MAVDAVYCEIASEDSLTRAHGNVLANGTAQHLAHDRRTGCEQKTQGIQKAQYPLPDRGLGQDIFDQQGSTLGYAPSTTARLALDR